MNAVLTKDLLLNMLLGLTALVLIILLNINPPAAANNASTESPGSIIVNIAWPDGPDDVDLWVKTPEDATAVGYSNKGGKATSLLRDDLGTAGDAGPFNREDAYSRGLADGEYIVNINAYAIRHSLPVSAQVSMSVNGMTKQLVNVTLDLKPSNERTVIRFRMKDGSLVPGSESHIFKSIKRAKT